MEKTKLANLTHLLPMHSFSSPENNRKPFGILFSEGELGTNGLSNLQYPCHHYKGKFGYMLNYFRKLMVYQVTILC